MLSETETDSLFHHLVCFSPTVVNDAARDAIPEELRLGLILTIYEAKGLEFDDVLLYNFFKDSQVGTFYYYITKTCRCNIRRFLKL